MGISSKSSPQSGKPWLHLPEGKTGQELLNRFLLWGCSSHCSRTGACGSLGCHCPSGCWSPAPGTSSPPPRVFEWRVLCGEGSTRPLAGSVTFPCPSGDPLGEPPSAGYSRTEPPQAGVIGAGHCRVPAVTASLPQAPGGAG